MGRYLRKKRTLIHLLEGCGNYRGIEVYRTPGEDAAIRLAVNLVKRTPIKALSEAAGKDCDPFWSKQW